jgi:hypothetical protein
VELFEMIRNLKDLLVKKLRNSTIPGNGCFPFNNVPSISIMMAEMPFKIIASFN